ncbi:MAG: F0F1 ATP synthase subunit B [Pseudomonadota bacterium]
MDATFWSLIALIIFIGIIAYAKVPALIGKSLDDRSEKIRTDLDEARKLREEAQHLLAEYQRKRKEAEQEAESIVASAKREAEALAKEAERKTDEYVARRTAQAELKIAQAEQQALADVKSTAVDIAVEAAQSVLESKMSGSANTDMFKSSLAEIKARMN